MVVANRDEHERMILEYLEQNRDWREDNVFWSADETLANIAAEVHLHLNIVDELSDEEVDYFTGRLRSIHTELIVLRHSH